MAWGLDVGEGNQAQTGHISLQLASLCLLHSMTAGVDPFAGGHACAQMVLPHGTLGGDLSDGKLTSAQSMIAGVDPFAGGHACVLHHNKLICNNPHALCIDNVTSTVTLHTLGGRGDSHWNRRTNQPAAAPHPNSTAQLWHTQRQARQ